METTIVYRRGVQIRQETFINYSCAGEIEESYQHRKHIEAGFKVIRVEERP